MNPPVIRLYLRYRRDCVKWNSYLSPSKIQFRSRHWIYSNICLTRFPINGNCRNYYSTLQTPTKTKMNLFSHNHINKSVIMKRNFSFKESLESMLSTHSSFFRSLSESKVVEYSQNCIVQIHDLSGLPWWLSIILTTCLVRTLLLFPLAVYQQYVLAKYINVGKEMNSFSNDLKYDINREVRSGRMGEKEAKSYYKMQVKKEYNKLIVRDNCHPVKAAILSLIQIPTWIIFSTSFRNLVYMLPHRDSAAELKFLELSMGGTAWFPNLTVADDFALPIMLGLTNLAIIEVQAMLSKGNHSKIQKYGYVFFRGFSICMIPVATFIPSCLTLYWLTSSLFGLCQNLIIISPRLRRAVGIPPTPSYQPHPYSHLAQQISSKFRK